MMTRVTIKNEPLIDGMLVYDEPEFIFTVTVPQENYETAPILISRTLSVECDIYTGLTREIWGYSPKESWHEEELKMPKCTDGSVYIDILSINNSSPLEAGVGIEDSVLYDTKTIFDKTNNTFRIGSDLACDEYVRIASGIIIGIKDDQFACVWLQPEEVVDHSLYMFRSANK